MTTNEKIDYLISKIIYKAPKLIWCKDPNGWAAKLDDRYIYVHHNGCIRITDWTHGDFIPPEDLNQIRPDNIQIRNELVTTVSSLYANKERMLDEVLAELSKL